MEPIDTDDTEHQDPLHDIPEIETITVNQGIIPEALLFWRRRPKPAPA